MSMILHCRKDRGTVAIHPEKATVFHILLGQAVDPNCNTLLLLPRNKVSTYNNYKVRRPTIQAHPKRSSSSKKLTLQLLSQPRQLPHQIFLSGGTPLRLRLPNVRMASDAKHLLLNTADAVTKKNKLQRIIQGWSRLRSR